jgi:hypothetical protein
MLPVALTDNRLSQTVDQFSGSGQTVYRHSKLIQHRHPCVLEVSGKPYQQPL